MVEPVQSRSTTVVLNALSQLVVRMKSYGINVNRLHSDRAKELIGRQTAALVVAMTPPIMVMSKRKSTN